MIVDPKRINFLFQGMEVGETFEVSREKSGTRIWMKVMPVWDETGTSYNAICTSGDQKGRFNLFPSQTLVCPERKVLLFPNFQRALEAVKKNE